MSTIPVIAVNELGQDENGDDYSHAPTPEALADGYVTSRPVILQYPDGRQVAAEQVLITKSGMEELSRRMAAEEGLRH